jgi:hypothetical protein
MDTLHHPAMTTRLAASIVDPARELGSEVDSWTVKKICRLYVAPTDRGCKHTNAKLRVPDCQRLWNWDGKRGLRRKRGIIDSVMHGFPIPPPVLNLNQDENGNDHWDIYDGRHRVQSLQDFCRDKFAIPVTVDGEQRMVRFSELHHDDQFVFENTKIPMIIAENATAEALSLIFSRMNDSVTLKDKDHLWAAKRKPLIKGTLDILATFRQRINAVMHIDYTPGSEHLRKDIPDWVGVVAGANQGNADVMTTSFIRLEPYLAHALHPDGRVGTFIDRLLTMYEKASEQMPTGNKNTDRSLVRLGKYAVFFADSLFKARANGLTRGVSAAECDAATIDRWVDIIAYERTRGAAPSLTLVAGAQNLNARKIAVVRERIRHWETTGTALGHGDPDDGEFQDAVTEE